MTKMSGRPAGLRTKAAIARWKSIVPVLYDWFANHHLVWPSLSCRWGPVIETHTFKTKQRIYLSEQTDGSVPNTLVVSNVEVVKPRVAAAEHISQFNEDNRSPFVRKYKTIIHPGEVNRIRELPQNSNIVGTHTDSPEVYIWNLESQPFRIASANSTPSIPDLILTGHADNAEFALSLSASNPFAISGGKDKLVVLWSLEDHITSLLAKPSVENSNAQTGNHTSSSPPLPPTPKLQPRGIFKGHENTIEDVQFHPSHAYEFCSVGDDSLLLFWDERSGTSPVISVKKSHGGADVHCVDWNSYDNNLILTGSADSTVKLFDRRKTAVGAEATALHTFRHHTEPVLSVQWCPDKSSVFGSGAEDGLLNIWNTENIGGPVIENNSLTDQQMEAPPPPELMFQHIGHRDRVLDFHWNNSDPWTIVSVSEEVKSGGGNLELWRISDLIHRSKEDVLKELKGFPSVFPVN